jgi:type IX secretion system PorP/SprF family membrane protein
MLTISIAPYILRSRRLLLAGLLLAAGLQADAQSFSNKPALLQPSGTQYYLNQYLANPAMAGLDSGLNLNAAHRRQWTGIDGAPVNTFITGDIRVGASGFGVNIYTDKAGQLSGTRVGLSYAYHLPLDRTGNRLLHFGLSLAINTSRVSSHELEGDLNDPSLAAYNDREDYFEGEYGMAYTDRHLTLQVSVPNARTLFSGKELGVNSGTVLYTAASYRLDLGGGISSLEPKLCYRAVKGYDGIVDAGVQLGFLDNVITVMGLYQSSKNFTGGAGVQIGKVVTIQAMYSTQTGGLKNYSDGTYELGVRCRL